MLTALQVAVFDDVGDLIRTASQESVLLAILLLACVLVNAFMVLNILIGFIYDLVQQTTSKTTADWSRRRVDATFAEIDKDLSGEITEVEYEAQAKPLLRAHGIDGAVIDTAFNIIDTDANGRLNRQEFAQYISKMLRAPSSEEVIKVMAQLSAAEAELSALLSMKQTGIVPTDLDVDDDSSTNSGIRRVSLFLRPRASGHHQ
jgi:hypothetical protein